MRFVAIAGVGSGSGKTSLIEALLPHLPLWGALKTTPHLAPPCRPGPPCPGCPGSEGRWRLCADPEILGLPGSDTARSAAAGARRVAWLRGVPPLDGEARGEVIARFEGCAGVLAEGRRLVSALSPERTIAIAAVGSGAPPLPDPDRLAACDRLVLHVRSDASRADRERLRGRAAIAGRPTLEWDGSVEGVVPLATEILSGPRKRS